jgi:hypothetical protein
MHENRSNGMNEHVITVTPTRHPEQRVTFSVDADNITEALENAWLTARRGFPALEGEDEDGEPVVTVEGRNYYTVPSTGYAICPECGATRPAERITDHMASEHDDDGDDDDGDTLIAGVLYDNEDGYEAEPVEDTGDFPSQGGGCVTRTGHFTGQAVCTACGPDCEHYLCTHKDEGSCLGHHTETALNAALEDMRRVQRNLEDTGRKRTRADVRAFRGLDEDRSMKLTPREVTQLEAALDEAEINHDTVNEQTGEDT